MSFVQLHVTDDGITSGSPYHQKRRFRISDLWCAPVNAFPLRDEIIYQYLELTPDLSLLEAGPGSGFAAYHLADQVRELTLLELGPANCERLRQLFRRRTNVRVVQHDLTHAAFPREIVARHDAAIAISVLELLPCSDIPLKTLASALRPGGCFLAQFANYPPEFGRTVTCFRTRRELDELFADAGFTHWEVYQLTLRPYAAALFKYCYSYPLEAYRHLCGRKARAINYDQSWALTNEDKLQLCRVPINTAWKALGALMSIGGDAFQRTPLSTDILHRNLLLLATR